MRAACTGRPHRPTEHLVVAGVVALVAAAHDAQCRRPTVRWPGVRIAPISSSWAFRQVGLVNSVGEGNEQGYNGIGQGEHGWAFPLKVGSG